jgi:hypothetical protein
MSYEPNKYDLVSLRDVTTAEQHSHTIWLYVALESFPPASRCFRMAKLADVDELEIDGHAYALYLKRRDWDDWDPSWQIPQRALARKGISADGVYEVEEWLLDNRAVRLRGIEGTYYAGLFENAK